MADEFDVFLRRVLEPKAREPDRAFVARVQAGVLWEERLQAERAAFKQRLLRQIAAVFSIAAALLWLARSPDLSAALNDSPGIILGVLLALFSFLVLVLNVGAESASRGFSTR